MAGLRGAYVLASVFCSGTAVMLVEMTTVRVITPWFGSTTYVWTNVIAVVMAALALGYFLGGRLADRRPSAPLLFGLMATGGLYVVLSTWQATAICKWILPQDVDLEGVSSVLIKGSLAATLILMAPAMVLLGTISPMAIRLLSGAGVGTAAGRVFAIGTVGSILGTYLPTLVLVPAIGSRGTMMFGAALLLAPAVGGLILFARGRGTAVAAALVVLSGSVTAVAETAPDRGVPPDTSEFTREVLYEGESEYQYLTVRDDTDQSGTVHRFLTINEGVYTYHSYRVMGQVLTNSRYYDDYALLPLLVPDRPPDEPLRGCVVGLAGGVTSWQWKHFWGGLYDLRVDGAEIDPEIVALGKRFFHLPADDAADGGWLDIHTMDGRQMLAAMGEPRGYHMLVVDAFSNELYIPFHLGTREFFELCKKHLAPDGILAMNVYARQADSENLLALENTLATVFGRCTRVRQYWHGNFILMARNGDEPVDLTRLRPSRIRARLGTRENVVEWDQLVANASRLPARSRIVWPQPHDPTTGRWVLTDDHAPLERLTDAFLERAEQEVLGE